MLQVLSYLTSHTDNGCSVSASSQQNMEGLK